MVAEARMQSSVRHRPLFRSCFADVLSDDLAAPLPVSQPLPGTSLTSAKFEAAAVEVVIFSSTSCFCLISDEDEADAVVDVVVVVLVAVVLCGLELVVANVAAVVSCGVGGGEDEVSVSVCRSNFEVEAEEAASEVVVKVDCVAVVIVVVAVVLIVDEAALASDINESAFEVGNASAALVVIKTAKIKEGQNKGHHHHLFLHVGRVMIYNVLHCRSNLHNPLSKSHGDVSAFLHQASNKYI